MGASEAGPAAWPDAAEEPRRLDHASISRTARIWLIACRDGSCLPEKSVPTRQYTDKLKVEPVRLAGSVGQHEAAPRLGVPGVTLGNWTRRRRRADGVGEAGGREVFAARAARPMREREAENRRLRKPLASAKPDIEILSKATASFANGARRRTPGSILAATGTASVT